MAFSAPSITLNLNSKPQRLNTKPFTRGLGSLGFKFQLWAKGGTAGQGKGAVGRGRAAGQAEHVNRLHYSTWHNPPTS